MLVTPNSSTSPLGIAVVVVVVVDYHSNFQNGSRNVLIVWIMSLLPPLPPLRILTTDADAAKNLRVSKRFLVATDKAREGAAILVSRLVTRPDMQRVLLPDFLAWTQAELSAADPGDVQGMVALTVRVSCIHFVSCQLEDAAGFIIALVSAR